jgi:hypothetical protein
MGRELLMKQYLTRELHLGHLVVIIKQEIIKTF